MPIRLSGKEIVRALSKDGWLVERVSGSHHVMRHPDGPSCQCAGSWQPASASWDARFHLPFRGAHG